MLKCLPLKCLFLSLVQVYINDLNFEENLQKWPNKEIIFLCVALWSYSQYVKRLYFSMFIQPFQSRAFKVILLTVCTQMSACMDKGDVRADAFSRTNLHPLSFPWTTHIGLFLSEIWARSTLPNYSYLQVSFLYFLLIISSLCKSKDSSDFVFCFYQWL